MQMPILITAKKGCFFFLFLLSFLKQPFFPSTDSERVEHVFSLLVRKTKHTLCISSCSIGFITPSLISPAQGREPHTQPSSVSRTPSPHLGRDLPLPVKKRILLCCLVPGASSLTLWGHFLWMQSSLSDSHVPRSCSLSDGTFCCCSLWARLILFLSLGNVPNQGPVSRKGCMLPKRVALSLPLRWPLPEVLSRLQIRHSRGEMLRVALIKI